MEWWDIKEAADFLSKSYKTCLQNNDISFRQVNKILSRVCANRESFLVVVVVFTKSHVPRHKIKKIPITAAKTIQDENPDNIRYTRFWNIYSIIWLWKCRKSCENYKVPLLSVRNHMIKINLEFKVSSWKP